MTGGVTIGTAREWEFPRSRLRIRASVEIMKVTFTKTGTDRSTMSVARGKGPSPAPRRSDDAVHLPHDLAQFVIEDYFDIRRGVFGQLAAAEGTVAAGQHDRSARNQRTARRSADAGRSDLARSERLIALCLPLWQARAGHAPTAPAVIDMTLATPFDVDRVLHRLDELSASWAGLESGESITLDWSATERTVTVGSPA